MKVLPAAASLCEIIKGCLLVEVVDLLEIFISSRALVRTYCTGCSSQLNTMIPMSVKTAQSRNLVLISRETPVVSNKHAVLGDGS